MKINHRVHKERNHRGHKVGPHPALSKGEGYEIDL